MRTALCERLGIDVPIIQAAMGGATCPALAAAVSNAGGLGMLALSSENVDSVRREIRQTRALTKRPFGVNLTLEWPQEEQLAASLEEGVPIVSFFWGDPARLVERVHASGAVALHTELFDVGWPNAPHRVLRNKTVDAWEAAGRPRSGERPGEGEVVATSPTRGQIIRYASATPRADAEGDIDALALWAGQGVGLVSRVQSAAEIVREIAEEARSTLRDLAAVIET